VKEYRIIRADNGRQRIAVTNRFYDTMDVAAGATYAYTVLAVDGAGNVSPPSAKVTVLTPVFDAAACAVDTAPPTGPENLRATVVTATAVTLEWDPATDAGSCGLAGYVLLRSGQDTGISVAGTSVTDDGLEPNQSYVYSVVARDNASNDSTPVDLSVTTLARPVLSQNPCQITAPRNLHGTGKSDTTVSIAWSPPTEDCDDLEQYLIYRGATLVGQTNGTSFTVSNLMPSTFYVFTVRAHNSDEETSPSSNSYMVRTAAMPDTTPPTEPSDLEITDRTPTDVRVEWTASTDMGGSGLKEYRVLLDGAFVGSTTVAGYTLSPLLPRTSHTVEVRAVDDAGNASAKVPISFTTAQSGPPVVNAPNPDPVVFPGTVTISGSNADYVGDVAIFIDGVEVAYVSSAANGTFQAIIDVDDTGYVIGTGPMLEAGMTYQITAFTPECLCASPPSDPRDFSVA
jgi:chitodextrinase